MIKISNNIINEYTINLIKIIYIYFYNILFIQLIFNNLY